MNKKQSLFHIAKRDTLPWYKAALIRGGAIVLALIVCAIVTTLLTGENPIKVYSTILYGAFGTSRKSWVTLHNLAILLGISLAVTPAFKMRFWNIGAEGQVLIGCLATAACMICLGDKVPGPVLILLMIVAAIAAGAAATSPQRPAMQRPARRRRNKSQNRCIPIRYAPVFCAVWFRSAVRRPRRTPVRSRSGRARLPAARSHRPHLLPCPCGTGRCCRPAPPCPRG